MPESDQKDLEQKDPENEQKAPEQKAAPAKPAPTQTKSKPKKVKAMVISRFPLIQPVEGDTPDILMQPNQAIEINNDSWYEAQVEAGLVKKVK